jgi:hypothetical protein
VIEALLRELRPDGWAIHDGRLWKSVRKYKAGSHRSAEARTVLGLALAAIESHCEVLVFIRDEDHDSERLLDIGTGVQAAALNWPELKIVSGIAVPCLEGWLLAVLETPGSESLSKSGAIQLLAKAGVAKKDTAAMVEFVRRHGISHVPEDATTLRVWIETARAALSE